MSGVGEKAYQIAKTVKANTTNQAISIANLQTDSIKQRRHISNYGAINDYQSFFTSTALKTTHRMPYTARCDAWDIQIVFGNWGVPNNSAIKDVDNSYDITITAGLWIGTSTVYQCKFSGNTSVTLKPGGSVLCDVIGVEISKGTSFSVRTCVTVGTIGDKYPLLLYPTAANNVGNDVTVSGDMTDSLGYGYVPIAVLGTTLDPQVLIIGDSIAAATSGAEDTGYLGYIARALDDGLLAWGKIARSSDEVKNFTGTNRQYRIKSCAYYRYAIVEYGINDLHDAQTFAQLQANLLSLWNNLVARGLTVYQTTITPRTNSTDSWATVENQTVWSSTVEANRVLINDWIRTVPAPLSGIFEIADLAETSRNSGIWKANYTGDGLHPWKKSGYVGVDNLKTGINTSVFV